MKVLTEKKQKALQKVILMLGCLLTLILILSLVLPDFGDELVYLESGSAGFSESTLSETDPAGSQSSSPSGVSEEQTGESETDTLTFPVYLTGAVARPGVYDVRKGEILQDLVNRAGGLLPDAAANQVNLAMIPEPNQMLCIPTKEEVENGSWQGLSANGKENAGNSSSPGSARQALIDINTADSSLLDTLPGIGSATADAIIRYREENGPFAQKEDIMQVPGIKNAKYSQIEEYILAGR